MSAVHSSVYSREDGAAPFRTKESEPYDYDIHQMKPYARWLDRSHRGPAADDVTERASGGPPPALAVDASVPMRGPYSGVGGNTPSGSSRAAPRQVVDCSISALNGQKNSSPSNASRRRTAATEAARKKGDPRGVAPKSWFEAPGDWAPHVKDVKGWDWCLKGRQQMVSPADAKAESPTGQKMEKSQSDSGLLASNANPGFHGERRQFGQGVWDPRMRGGKLARDGWAGTFPLAHPRGCHPWS
eukprot:gnl/TRDRNA2_/TRDRNA2_55572_c0_seq1.p1 gnl/TRDRNA2_/TRDRNA2_55572_c0~~gnl/TRDRNA2_/TRDRNA2_55572_c0_seq1.p1  ORF type:complete len:243 (+),score=20.77 gnl/TRDRNA2_/TRDRNA2_55572_c0_seq1:64-792(+)